MKAFLTPRGAFAKPHTEHLLRRAFGLILAFVMSLGEAGAQTTTWVSHDSDGNEGDGTNTLASVSADGRYVAFQSNSGNLVAQDTNECTDIFVHDLWLSETRRVSISSDGTEGNDSSYYASISADGRYVAFLSRANNLVPLDTNGWADVFVHDRNTGETTRVSVSSDGDQATSLSYVSSISADGLHVAIQSAASNLVTGDSNGTTDIFVHDREADETTLVSIDSDGNQADSYSWNPSISADGRYVAFQSVSTNLVPEDNNETWDVFVHDRQLGKTTRVSVDSDGNEANDYSYNPSLSEDGRYVAFYSWATNLVPLDTNGQGDIFVHDCESGETTRVSVDSDGNEAESFSQYPSISADGRFIAFDSQADNLVPDDTNGWVGDIFVHDRETGETVRVSVDSYGNEANDYSRHAAISGNGRYVAFQSEATNLVVEDTYSNYLGDEIYVRGPLTDAQLEVTVDIAPNRDVNRINPERGRLAVAIVTDEAFDATQVDPASVRFGPEEAASVSVRRADIDRDGDTDLVLQFQTAETGISCGDTEATLTGLTYQGISVSGTDAITPVGCR